MQLSRAINTAEYGTTRENAERLAALALSRHVSSGWRPPNLTHGCVPHDFAVRQHAHLSGGHEPTWGVWPAWAYADRPDLGPVFGGPFVDLRTIEGGAR
jgi:hypothetical protein